MVWHQQHLQPLDENAWRKAVEGTRAAGGNAIRWWLFNNMSQSPEIDPTTHLVKGLKKNTVQNMKKALDIAEEYGVMVSMCLFSHNLMEPEQWGIYTGEKVDITANEKLFTDAGTVAFINKVLAPVVRTLGNHPALMSWEIFNEPEGMTTEGNGWTTKKMSKANLQKFTNKVAAAIHKANKDLLVSTGSVNIQYQNWWNDEELIKAGGEKTGTLDFFQTHYYPYYQADEVSPFVNTAAAMQTKYKYDSKPMIIGEFPASGWKGDTYTASMAAKTQISAEEAYQKAYDGGYAGALAWQYIGDKTEANFGGYSYTIDPALDAMKKLAATAANDYIKIKDVTVDGSTGDGKMAVTYGADNGQIEYQNKGGWDLSGATTFTWTAKNNGTSAAQLNLIFKLTDEWKWTETKGQKCEVPAGEKVTCSIDISTLTDRNKTVAIVIANYAKGYKGTVIYDDIKAGETVLFDFNEDKYDAFGRGYGNTEAMIPEIKIVYSEDYKGSATAAAELVIDYTPLVDEIDDGTDGSSNSNANSNSSTTALFAGSVTAAKLSVQGSNVMLSTAAAKDVSVDVFSMMGKHVANLHRGSISAGTHAFSVADMPRGNYVVRVKGVGYTATHPVVVK